VYRFRIPHVVITNNGRQFTNRRLDEFYEKLDIKHITSSMEHTQTNDQVDVANKITLNELKRRLDPAKGKWTQELLEVL